MNKMIFHEATVVGFCRHDAVFELELEDVLVEQKKSRVLLMVQPVLGVTIDGEPSNDLLMEADDGEILTLELSDDFLSMVIEWNDFSHKKSVTKSYHVFGGKTSISIR
jgi:hypothetical protein